MKLGASLWLLLGRTLVFFLWPGICVCFGRAGVLVTLGAEFRTSPETEFLNSFVFEITKAIPSQHATLHPLSRAC